MARRMVRRRNLSWYSLPEADKLHFSPEDVWLAKHKGKHLYSKVVQIKCLGKVHKIQMLFPGAITLLNHPDKRGEQTMMKLGGSKPECLTFLEQWKTGEHEAASVAYSRPIAQQFLQARQDWRKNRLFHRNQYTDWLQKPILKRLRSRIDDIYDHLKELVAKREPQRHQYAWQGAKVTNTEPEQELVRATFHLSFKDLLNNPNNKEERTDDQETTEEAPL